MRGTYRLALTGGSAAVLCYPRWADVDLGGASLSVFWGDERAVPLDHPDSNYALAKRLWFDGAGAAGLGRVAMHLHPMSTDDAPLEVSAQRYATLLGDAPLDLVHLGLGEDGHLASLFPGHGALSAPDRVVAIHDAPKPPPSRLTLTMDTLVQARLLLFTVTGASKALAVREALFPPEGSPPGPAAVALQRGRALVLVDEAAAVALPTQASLYG